jgi:hypothetical protein
MCGLAILVVRQLHAIDVPITSSGEREHLILSSSEVERLPLAIHPCIRP